MGVTQRQVQRGLDALLNLAPFAEVAVIGESSEKWGESATAVAVLRAGSSLDIDELRGLGPVRVAHYKLPTTLEFIEALPRNPAGRLLKFELRDRFER